MQPITAQVAAASSEQLQVGLLYVNLHGKPLLRVVRAKSAAVQGCCLQPGHTRASATWALASCKWPHKLHLEQSSYTTTLEARKKKPTYFGMSQQAI